MARNSTVFFEVVRLKSWTEQIKNKIEIKNKIHEFKFMHFIQSSLNKLCQSETFTYVSSTIFK